MKLNLFISSLKEMKKNMELKLSTFLSRIGVVRSSAGVVIAGSVGVAPIGGSHLSG